MQLLRRPLAEGGRSRTTLAMSGSGRDGGCTAGVVLGAACTRTRRGGEVARIARVQAETRAEQASNGHVGEQRLRNPPCGPLPAAGQARGRSGAPVRPSRIKEARRVDICLGLRGRAERERRGNRPCKAAWRRAAAAAGRHVRRARRFSRRLRWPCQGPGAISIV